MIHQSKRIYTDHRSNNLENMSQYYEYCIIDKT